MSAQLIRFHTAVNVIYCLSIYAMPLHVSLLENKQHC